MKAGLLSLGFLAIDGWQQKFFRISGYIPLDSLGEIGLPS